MPSQEVYDRYLDNAHKLWYIWGASASYHWKVQIYGCGCDIILLHSLYRGSAISKIIGLNVQNSANFDTTVRMWVYEEIVDGRNLSEIINEQHENVKYLPGVHLPENVS